MEVSVLIPTFGRAEKLARCLECLAHQTFERERFEVLVGVDGRAEHERNESEAAAAAHALAEAPSGSVRAVVHQFEHAGPGATRNRLAAHARGKVLLLLNDDVLPDPDLIGMHWQAHRRIGKTAMVLGAAPWVVHEQDRLFDRLIRETSMVFFYDRMEEMLESGEVGADHDWGFRHAWTLNLSLPREAFEKVNGFDERLRYACYEDLEFAWRVRRATDAPVRYEPLAMVRHDHRIMPEDYLRRERMMGRAAWSFAAASPECACEVFGRDIRSGEEIEYSRAFVERERGAAEKIGETFRALAMISSDVITGSDSKVVLRALYEQHLLLKRWTWREGLLEAQAMA